MPTLLDALVETPPRVEPEPGQSPRTIGTAHQPVRVIAFSSGGFDAAMQLGVTHALLTINGKAPDAAVGVSAGAVNAAALAEVFQAAPDPADWPDLDPAARDQMLHDRQRARVARFRKMLEACLSAPGELARAMLPDTLQVEAQQPLRPLELPIHERKERDGRQKELHARQGFINLFNDLLGLKVSFGTLTRLFRRMLGWQAAAEIRSTAGRLAARSFELARVWALIAVNFPRAAWVIQRLVAPLFSDRAKPRGEAATAAAIIFRPRWLRALRRVLVRAVMTLLLFLLWITISLCVIGVPFLALRLLSGALWVLGGSLDLTGPARVAAWLDQNLPVLLAILYAVLGGALAIGLWMTGAWGQIANFNRTRPRAVLGEAGLEAVGFGLLLAGSLVPPFALFALVGWIEGQRTLGGMLERGLVIGEHVFWWLLLVLAGGFAYAWSRNAKDSYLQRLLARYDIADGLLSTHPLRQFFIPLFDPEYYGERQMDDVVDRALRDNYDPSVTGPRPPKVIASYERQSPPITVGLMVANVKTGNLEIVPDCTKVVDGLIAATSVSPLFPPVPILGKLYLDGANISTEAIPGVITLLRDRVNPAASVIHVYSVSHLPFSQPAMAPAERGDRPYLNLLDVANRAMQLQRFRDAALERRLTELFTRAIPPGRAVFPVGDKGYLRVWVAPVEPDAPLELNDRLARCCSPEDARQLISEAVADGCRASLEVMLRGSLPADAGVTSIPCRQAVDGHRARANPSVALPLLVDLDKTSADRGAAPGLPGVCSHCALSRNGPNGGSSHRGELAVREWKQVGPVWPHELEQSPLPLDAPVPTTSGRWAISPDPDPHFVRAKPAYEERTSEVLSALKRTYWNGFQNVRAGDRWPSVRNGGTPGNQRPLVNLLFSGGVFRGVYQLGTLAALSEAGLEPDVIAGASVGSITGAMVAQALAFPPGPERDGRVARLAATYLAMDRLVLTDRFADFIRGLTLRAAATRFSLHQADGFLRRYDQADSDAFDREARMVMAGLERLFYLSPFELKELVKAFRLRQSNQVYEMLRAHTQEWLDRMGVGNQILGAEPLALLITEHVLQPLQGERFTVAESVQFDRYLSEAGIYFLATATNLTEGRLEILGEQQLQGQDTATLLEGLLASSAFPGVFRPRWSWEVMPGSTRQDQYIDGGVMDNLPLDAVAHFLRVASEPELGIVARRPRYQAHDVPHLLFSASLEIIPVEPTERELNRYLTEWPVVWRRARQLRYNKKLELYALAQRALRDIWNAGTDGGGGWKPVDLEVVMVRPRWLPGTFGFHPMLGFRRQRQAESIAHGCATALLELARTARRHPEWAAGWGLDPDRLPGDPPATDRDPIVPGEAQRGHCWFRPGAVCPFSEERLGATGLPKRTIEELSKIYAACGRPETHQPR